MSDREYIKISLRLAKDLIGQGMTLYREGAGSSDEVDPTGLIDGIPIDSDSWHWANALLSFARYVAGLLQNEIDEDNILRITEE